jgi:4-amino-4-deoxy-L-arabinose transferase-like glycosyltransferase
MKPLATPLLRHQFVIVVVACIALLTNLGATRLWDQDEAYFAGAAAEMFARGDWVTPQFNHELFAHKPPLMYWLMIGGYQLFGRTEFAARIGSALLGVATGLLVYHTARRLFSPTVGLWSALAMVTCLMFDIVARAATPDCHLVFFTALSIFFFVTRCPEARLLSQEGGGSAQGAAWERPGRWPTPPWDWPCWPRAPSASCCRAV